MIDHEARAMAWLRKKPRRIIQSQGWIVTFDCILVVGTTPFCTILFWLVWGIYPSLIVPSLFVLWIITFSIYVIGNLATRLKQRHRAT